MSYEPKDNSGALFRNDKAGVETRPDYRGDLMIDGSLYEVAGWLKEGAKGKFLSLSVKPKDAKPAKAARVEDDEIPF